MKIMKIMKIVFLSSPEIMKCFILKMENCWKFTHCIFPRIHFILVKHSFEQFIINSHGWQRLVNSISKCKYCQKTREIICIPWPWIVNEAKQMTEIEWKEFVKNHFWRETEKKEKEIRKESTIKPCFLFCSC